MTLDWPLVALVSVALAALILGLRTVLPYFVGHSSEQARAKALDDVNKRLAAVESALIERRMPGRMR